MLMRKWALPLGWSVAVAWGVLAALGGADQRLWGSEPGSHATTEGSAAARVAERVVPGDRVLQEGEGREHPLAPAIAWAREGLQQIEEEIEDYSATLVKRERVGNTLNDYEYMFIKVRHEPFSVYMHFLHPPSVRGQEVIYIEGANDGNMWAHGTGIQQRLFGTVSLRPDGIIAMQGQRYPITELGILNLLRRLIEIGEADMKYGECEVHWIRGARVGDRSVTCIEVIHPKPRRNFLFHIARIFVDDELNIPIRYEAHDWPAASGGPPRLIEEYTYMNLKLNNGFTDADFDIRNPAYDFRVK